MEPLFTRAFLLAAGAHFLHALAFALYLHLPGFLLGIGATEVQIGIIFGLTGFTAILARPALGRAMDVRGRRFVIIAGGVMHASICMAYLAVSHLGPLVYVVRIVHGVAEAMLFASLFALAADLVPASRRIQGIALFGISGMLPMSLSGLLGDVILAHASYARLFQVSAVFASLALLLSLSLRDPARAGSGEPSRSFFAAVTQRDLLPLWATGICFATAIAAYFTFMKTYVAHTGVGSVGTFFTAYSLSAIALRILFGSLPDRVGPRVVLLPALASLALGLLGLAYARTNFEIAASGVLCGFGHGFTFPILLGFVVQRSRASERGATLAVYTALFDGGTLIGGPMLGGIVSHFGYRVMFTSAAGLVMLGGAVFLVSDRCLSSLASRASSSSS